jgi:hypothetical protein
VDAGQAKTPVGDKVSPKKLKPTQKPMWQKKGDAGEKDVQEAKKDAQVGKKDIASQKKDQRAGAMGT